MIGDQNSNVEFFPKWICPYEDCKAENDITNPVRCWKCDKRKPTESGYKRILTKIKAAKEKKDAAATKTKVKQMNVQDTVIEESATAVQSDNQDTHLEFDLDKLESDDDV